MSDATEPPTKPQPFNFWAWLPISGVLLDFVVTFTWWIFFAETFYRLLQLKALLLLPKLLMYFRLGDQFFFIDWCYVVYYLQVIAVSLGNAWLLDMVIAAMGSSAVASLLFCNAYSAVSYDRFSSAQMHLMPGLAAFALQFRTSLDSECDLALHVRNSAQAGISPRLFARSNHATNDLSVLGPALVGYFIWLLCWIVVIFLGVRRYGYGNLYDHLMENMGVKGKLPEGLRRFSPALYCLGHVALSVPCMPFVLLGPVMQGLLVGGCVVSALVRGAQEAALLFTKKGD